MTLLNTINVGGTNYGITGAAVIGSCVTPAGSEIKVCTFSDTFELKAGDMLLVKFTYANTYGDGSTTYPKLQVNGTNYVMRRADGNYLQSGEWGNNATLTFLFDGTDFILPAGSGTGNAGGIPLGTVLAIYTNQVPDGYLPCNGVQFDTAQFAALYALLGDDHTPDLREVTLRGIGHNGTYVFDSTETDPSTGQAGTQNHDEYTLGEFKDDQLQEHSHILGYSNSTGTGNGAARGSASAGDLQRAIADVLNARAGTVTRGKSVGVNYIIKATSGLPDSQQDYILNQLAPVDEVTADNMHSVTSNAVAAAISYTSNEHFTGRYWVNGKKIYARTIQISITSGNHSFNHGIADIDYITDFKAVSKSNNSGEFRTIPFLYYGALDAWGADIYVTKTMYQIECGTAFAGTHSVGYLTLEYTKTTY